MARERTSRSVCASSIKLVVDCSNWEKFCPLILSAMGDGVAPGSGTALTHCGIGSYLRFWLLMSGIVRAIEFIEVTAEKLCRVRSGSAVMLLHWFH